MSTPAPRVGVSRRSVLAAVGAGVLVGAWALAFFVPESRHLDTLEAQRAALQASLAADRARLRRVEHEAAYAGQLEAIDARLHRYAPSSAQLYPYIHTISTAARSAHVTITSLNPEGAVAVAGTPYAAVPIAASVKGTYDDLLAFLKELYTLPRLTDVNDLYVSGGGPGSTRTSPLSVSLQLAIFTTQLPAGAATTSSSSSSPAATRSAGPASRPALPACGALRDPFDPTGAPPPAGSPARC